MASGFCELEWGCTGRLTVNSVDLWGPAWVAPSLTRLWFDFEERGESVLLPGAPGRRSNPTRYDEVEVLLPFFLNGVEDHLGAPYASAWQGLADNLDYLYTNVFAPVTTGRGTVAASLESPDGLSTKTADVRMLPLQVAEEIEDPTYVAGVITLIIPAGRFT